MKFPARGLLLAAVCCTLFAGCDSDDSPVAPEVPANGTIQVSVRDRFGSAVAGATVRTNPQVGGGTTDAFGQLLIPDVAAGVYTIVATHGTGGSAQSALQVDAGQLEQLALTLDPAIRLAPLVDIQLPLFLFEYSYVDSLSLVGSVMDIEDPAPSLTLQWRSSVDGVLSTAPADEKGLSSVRHGPLSLGTHWLSLRAEDSDGYVGTDSVRVVVRSFPPVATVSQPAPGATFAPGEAVTFLATVTDRETPEADLAVEWRSDLDGVLNQDPPAADGTTTFTTSTLSHGVHAITLSVRDGDDHTVTQTKTVANDAPQRVVLDSIEKDASSLVLHWTPLDEPAFASYRVYRATSASGPFTVIDVLLDPQADHYRDQQLTLGQTYWYRVGLLTDGGSESASNVLSGSAGLYIATNTQVEAMIADPARPYLYAVDRVNNSLLFIDTDSLKVVKTIFIGSSPSDLDIDAAGNELFVANYGSSEIAVVDLATQTKSRSLLVDTGGGWDGNPYRLVCATPGRLVWTSLDQWNSLRLIDSQTGALLHMTGSVYYPDLVASPDGSRIYVGESGSSGSKIYRFDVVGNQLSQVDQTPGYGYGYSTRKVTLSGDGAYAFYAAKKILATNLGSELGTFSEVIYAANQAGTVAVGESKLFDATTYATLRNLPIAGTIKTIGPDGSTLYSYDNTSSRIYVVDVSVDGAPAGVRLP